MKVKEPSDKAGLHLHLKTRITATEEIYNVSTGSEDRHIVCVLHPFLERYEGVKGPTALWCTQGC